jgi:hypothetical protein
MSAIPASARWKIEPSLVGEPSAIISLRGFRNSGEQVVSVRNAYSALEKAGYTVQGLSQTQGMLKIEGRPKAK